MDEIWPVSNLLLLLADTMGSGQAQRQRGSKQKWNSVGGGSGGFNV